MFVGHLENIFVPDLNNPDVSLNAFQVWDKFETNWTKTQKLKQIAQRRKKLLFSWTGNKELDGELRALRDGG